MQEKTEDLLREELHERVWTTPKRKLAQEFKYSDVGLAKLCRRDHIPTPGLGYWRKIELGHKPPRVLKEGKRCGRVPTLLSESS